MNARGNLGMSKARPAAVSRNGGKVGVGGKRNRLQIGAEMRYNG